MARIDYFEFKNAATLPHGEYLSYDECSWRVVTSDIPSSVHRNHGNIIDLASNTVTLSADNYFGYFSPGWKYILPDGRTYRCMVKLSGIEQRTPTYYYGSINGKAPMYSTIEGIKKELNITCSRKKKTV